MRELRFRLEGINRPTPDISLLRGTVHPDILSAMRTASKALSEAGVRHVLVGGLAVGTYGHPRATKDVDFLVGDEAFEFHEGGIVTLKVPIQVGNVPVDNLAVPATAAHLSAALEKADESEGIPIAPIEALVYMKLASPRTKDAADVVELVKVGVDTARIEEYLQTNAPELVAKWAKLLKAAGEE